MKVLAIVYSMLFVSFANAGTAVKFTQVFRVKDVVCCGARMSEVHFDNLYLKTAAGDVTAKVKCAGALLSIQIVKGSFFDISSNDLRVFTEQKGSNEECKNSKNELLKVSPENPFIFNPIL